MVSKGEQPTMTFQYVNVTQRQKSDNWTSYVLKGWKPVLLFGSDGCNSLSRTSMLSFHGTTDKQTLHVRLRYLWKLIPTVLSKSWIHQ